ncbi:hypothetical protein [Streptomyces decoyicus]
MALLEKQPNNTAIDAQLRDFGIDPTRISSLPVVDPNAINPDYWPVVDIRPMTASGVIGRHKVMRYDFGAPTAISSAVGNATSSTIVRKLVGEKTISTSTTYSISSTVESGFFDVVKVSVTAGFSQTWEEKKRWEDSLEVPIKPGHMMWLEVRPVMRILEGDFVFFFRLGSPFKPKSTTARFSGTVTAPGVEGTLRDVIVAREAPMTSQMAEELLSAAESETRAGNLAVRRNDDGTLTLPGFLAADLLGDSAKSEDVTDQIKPA